MRKLGVFIAAAIAFSVCLATATPALAAERGAEYVALGDSAAAGPGITPVDTSAPLCGRSLDNYPKLAAKELDLSIDDVTCSGATTAHMMQSQYPTVAPQFNALGSATKYVTVEIGANNILKGISDAVVPAGAPRSLASSISGVLDGIKDRAPNAKIFVVGYPTYYTASQCTGLRSILPGSGKNAQATIDQVNAVLSDQADKHDLGYVDLAKASREHTTCAPNGQAWVNGTVGLPGNGVGFHPTRTGMQAFADIVSSAMK